MIRKRMMTKCLCFAAFAALICAPSAAFVKTMAGSGDVQGGSPAIHRSPGEAALETGQDRRKTPDQPKIIPLPVVKPVIKSWFDVPLGALKPGTKLYLKGEAFGTQPGKILMYHKFPDSPIELQNVMWSSDKSVEGVVPKYMDGQSNQKVSIRVQRADKILSDPIVMEFIGRLEYTCPETKTEWAHILYGSDGSEKDCTPYICRTDPMGDRCLERCTHKGECVQPTYVCDWNGLCVIPEKAP